MKVKDIPFYYLNWIGYTDRKIKMEILTKKWGVNAICITNPSYDDNLRQTRIAKGSLKTLEFILKENCFPCIITDDDIQLISSFPENIDLNDKADLIFLGGSLYNCGGIKPDMYISDFDENFYRVFYMLGLHATLLQKKEAVEFLMNVMNESLKSHEFSDILITMKSKDFVFLSPKIGPFFYQDNYNENLTKFLWKDYKNVLLKF